ncbi:glycosyltransferase [Chitinophaga sp. HK235]|uniref:glycosyltransferase n=1 Tax=Chitinophaga sp. HK235 TaxID=2952571 RepID=UPI001BA4C38F|nr:glycosyltransferase [Chitinophaga sp. HK235]
MIDYSLVIYTCDPDERILRRCLQAVQQLNRNQLQIEVLLVDNNSTIPLSSLSFIKDFLQHIPNLQLLLVKEQGVGHARIAAIEAARGEHIVYIDYNNEPDSNYLQELTSLYKKYPQVAAWGPGQVQVDFIDGIESNIEHYARLAFQQRKETTVTFSAVPAWQSCYPFGTGLCTKTFLLKEYVQHARKGTFTLPGRKGNQLSSGEGTQMVLLCVRNGYAAGVAPTLKLTHIIPAGRANRHYLQRLIYDTFVCYDTCLMQIFPSHRNLLGTRLLSASRFSRKAIGKLWKARWSSDPHRLFELVQYIATHASVYAALNKPVPLPVSSIIRYLKVE